MKGETERKDHDSIEQIGVTLEDYLNSGSIRLAPESSGFLIGKEPTSEQYARLEDYIKNYALYQKEPNNIIVEIQDGDNEGINEYYEKSIASPQKIIADIKNYFKTGDYSNYSKNQTDMIKKNSNKGSFSNETETSTDSNIKSIINHSITMAEAKDMIQRAFVANNLKDWYEEKYKNGDEWLAGEGAEEVATYIENTESTVEKYINTNYERIKKLILFFCF